MIATKILKKGVAPTPRVRLVGGMRGESGDRLAIPFKDDRIHHPHSSGSGPPQLAALPFILLFGIRMQTRLRFGRHPGSQRVPCRVSWWPRHSTSSRSNRRRAASTAAFRLGQCHANFRFAYQGGPQMRFMLLAVILFVSSVMPALAQDRPTKPTPGWIRCSQWCAKCKPDEGCRATCRSSGNRYVRDSCTVRGNG
jgi:hypothetical protein